MKKPIRTTLIFGVLSALCALPIITFSSTHFGWSTPYKLFVFFNVAIYTMLLCQWSKKPITSVLFPLLLVLGVTLWPVGQSGFLLISLAVFGWIRSGICYSANPLRSILAETITLAGGAGFIFILLPNSFFALPIAVWLFCLFQTLYFYIVPGITEHESAEGTADSFDQACREMERLLESNSVR